MEKFRSLLFKQTSSWKNSAVKSSAESVFESGLSHQSGVNSGFSSPVFEPEFLHQMGQTRAEISN